MTSGVMYEQLGLALFHRKEHVMLNSRFSVRRASYRAHLFAALFSIGVLTTMSANPVHANKTPGALPTDAEGFYFLEGQWRVHNRKLKEPPGGKDEWIEFEAKAKFFTLLEGLVSVEELRDAKGGPFGSAVRTFDREKRTWSDAWISARNGVLNEPVHGRFEGNVGVWDSPDTLDGKPIIVRGLWRRVTKDELIWEQTTSKDNGKTWDVNWKMRFERIAEIAKGAK